MSALLAPATPRRIKATHRRRGKVASGRFVQRYYDAEIIRFPVPDPVGPEEDFVSHFNRYKYASNNPYMYTDPDGRADLNLFNKDDRLYEAGKAFDIPKMFTIAGHGAATFVWDQNKNELNPAKLLELARVDGLKVGQTIFLAACNTGAGNFAQVMADLNNSIVIAPVGYTMLPSTKDENPNDQLNAYKPGSAGTISVSTDKKDREGHFAAFAPGGKGPLNLPANISSVKFNPKGDATVRMRPETGSRIGRTITIKKEDK